MGHAYRIMLPGALYDALVERNAFHNDSAEDQSSLRAMNNAARVRRGKGFRYVLVGGEKALRNILAYVAGLPDLISSGSDVTAGEYGVTVATMERVAAQSLTAALTPVSDGKAWAPVPHRVTGVVVGYIRPGEFWDIDKKGPLPESHRIKEG